MTEPDLDGRVAELRESAARLRALPADAPAEDAAALVQRCAELAGEVANELERRYRDARAESSPGQERLL